MFIDVGAQRVALFGGGHGVQLVPRLAIVGTRRLDFCDKLLIIFSSGWQYQVAQLRADAEIGIHHVVGQTNFHHFLVHDVVNQARADDKPR